MWGVGGRTFVAQAGGERTGCAAVKERGMWRDLQVVMRGCLTLLEFWVFVGGGTGEWMREQGAAGETSKGLAAADRPDLLQEWVHCVQSPLTWPQPR